MPASCFYVHTQHHVVYCKYVVSVNTQREEAVPASLTGGGRASKLFLRAYTTSCSVLQVCCECKLTKGEAVKAMERQRIATSPTMERQRIATSPTMERQRITTSHTMERQRIATSPTMERQRIATSPTMERQRIATSPTMDLRYRRARRGPRRQRGRPTEMMKEYVKETYVRMCICISCNSVKKLYVTMYVQT